MKFPKPMVVKLNIFETPQPDRHLIARCKTEVYAKSEVDAWLKELRKLLDKRYYHQGEHRLAREILEEWLPEEEGKHKE